MRRKAFTPGLCKLSTFCPDQLRLHPPLNWLCPGLFLSRPRLLCLWLRVIIPRIEFHCRVFIYKGTYLPGQSPTNAQGTRIKTLVSDVLGPNIYKLLTEPSGLEELQKGRQSPPSPLLFGPRFLVFPCRTAANRTATSYSISLVFLFIACQSEPRPLLS